MHLRRIVVGALLASATIALAAGGAAATTGISMSTSLTTQSGSFSFNLGGGFVVGCSATMTKTLVTGLVAVQQGLTKIGRIASGSFACNGALLNLPATLEGGTPGPNPNSWDVAFISSDPATGDMLFEVLDFQVALTILGQTCLYRGDVRGTLSADGSTLRYGGTMIPLFRGPLVCAALAAVGGEFADSPSISYQLLAM